LNDAETRDFMAALDERFDLEVDIPRIRHGKRQELDTLISEEALLFAKYLRGEKESWNPRIPCLEMDFKVSRVKRGRSVS
jgi:hypothetical protein